MNEKDREELKKYRTVIQHQSALLESRFRGLEDRVAELEARIPAPEIVPRAPARSRSLEYVIGLENAANRLLEFARPMGDSDRIKAWDELARAVRS